MYRNLSILFLVMKTTASSREAKVIVFGAQARCTSKVKPSSEIWLHAKKNLKVFHFFKYRHNHNQNKICFNIRNFQVDCFGLLKHKQRSFVIQYFHWKYLFSSKFTKTTYETATKVLSWCTEENQKLSFMLRYLKKF